MFRVALTGDFLGPMASRGTATWAWVCSSRIPRSSASPSRSIGRRSIRTSSTARRRSSCSRLGSRRGPSRGATTCWRSPASAWATTAVDVPACTAADVVVLDRQGRRGSAGRRSHRGLDARPLAQCPAKGSPGPRRAVGRAERVHGVRAARPRAGRDRARRNRQGADHAAGRLRHGAAAGVRSVRLSRGGGQDRRPPRGAGRAAGHAPISSRFTAR